MRLAGLIAAAATAALLGGCLDRAVAVDTGEYTAVGGVGEAGRAAAREIRRLTVDREQQTVTLALENGSQAVLSFTARPRDEWPAGCPTNVSETYMEVLDLTGGPLTLPSLAISDPILVRDCPADPVQVALRADGEIGGGGSACVGAGDCIRFQLAD